MSDCKQKSAQVGESARLVPCKEGRLLNKGDLLFHETYGLARVISVCPTYLYRNPSVGVSVASSKVKVKLIDTEYYDDTNLHSSIQIHGYDKLTKWFRITWEE